MVKEIEIPKGYEAKIENNKVIFVPKESEEESIRKNLIELLLDTPAQDIISHNLELSKVLAYLEKQKDQKPAEWSEEDKEMLFFLNEFMDSKGKDYFSTLVYPKIKIWLESIHERFNLEPKQKWSEEDENVIKNLIELVEGEPYNNFYESSKDTILKWLKSLRPQPHWKPSEEQMEILQYVCTQSSHPNQKVISVLESLYNDLKKL